MICLLALGFLPLAAQSNDGAISTDMLSRIEKSYGNNPQDKAIRNALGSLDMNKLALSQENLGAMDTEFSTEVKSIGITDQKKSGRCWLFTGLNVLRAKAIATHNLSEMFSFSQSYIFFYDQLEKSNLFLQCIIDTRKEAIDSQDVDWLFSNPIGDGGTFTGVTDLVNKYGLVPADAMPESFAANNTSRMNSMLKLKLRQGGIQIREMAANKASMAQLLQKKEEILKDIYRILALNLGIPPKSFSYDGKEWTPMQFAEEYGNKEICNDYIMLMNDPSREYYKCYEIDRDRHTYEGHNWLYVNLPIEDIKEMAIASLKDNTAMYFSCDVAKYLNSERGLLDIKNYDYESLLGVSFDMDKRQRVSSKASGSSHAMTLVAVDEKDGKVIKWKVENSWGATSGYKGYLIMTDEWFNEYMFRLVVNRKYATVKALEVLNQKPIKLPSWDPMFANEE